jgi:hypothetical protein
MWHMPKYFSYRIVHVAYMIRIKFKPNSYYFILSVALEKRDVSGEPAFLLQHCH